MSLPRITVAILAVLTLGAAAWLHSELVGVLSGLLMGGATLWKRGLAS